MSKAIRIATAAALGIAIAVPVLAEDIKAPAPGATGQPICVYVAVNPNGSS